MLSAAGAGAGVGVGVARVVGFPVVPLGVLVGDPLVVPPPAAGLVLVLLVLASGVLAPPWSPALDVVVLGVGVGLADPLAMARSCVTTACAFAWRSDGSGR